MNYDVAKNNARAKDENLRLSVAQNNSTTPELLYFLASDAADTVRVAVAQNPQTPRQADRLLADDRAIEVRQMLAQKIARLLPQLAVPAQQSLGQLTYDILLHLARDQAASVRQVIATELKDHPYAPPQLINELARDLELAVAEPVLQFSPVLTDEDLLDIITSAPIAGAMSAIARRNNLSGQVADGIEATQDSAAIAALLANNSAQIREATLDRIVNVAAQHTAWHEPLVHRPALPDRLITKLASFVSNTCLQVLCRRPGLDLDLLATLREKISQNEPARAIKPEDYSEEQLSGYLLTGKTDIVRQALAARSGISMVIVEKILAAQSARGTTALVWRAGLSMRFAMQAQTRLAQIMPTQILNARGGFDYPLSDDEMRWQLEFFGAPTKN